MTVGDWLDRIPDAAKAVTAVLLVVGSVWKTATWAKRRDMAERVADEEAREFEKAREARESTSLAFAEGANERLFKFIEPRLKEFERRCAECELDRARDRVEMRKEFNAEMALMQAQYVERVTVLTARIMVLEGALRAAGRAVPPPDLFVGPLPDGDLTPPG